MPLQEATAGTSTVSLSTSNLSYNSLDTALSNEVLVLEMKGNNITNAVEKFAYLHTLRVLKERLYTRSITLQAMQGGTVFAGAIQQSLHELRTAAAQHLLQCQSYTGSKSDLLSQLSTTSNTLQQMALKHAPFSPAHTPTQPYVLPWDSFSEKLTVPEADVSITTSFQNFAKDRVTQNMVTAQVMAGTLEFVGHVVHEVAATAVGCRDLSLNATQCKARDLKKSVKKGAVNGAKWTLEAVGLKEKAKAVKEVLETPSVALNQRLNEMGIRSPDVTTEDHSGTWSAALMNMARVDPAQYDQHAGTIIKGAVMIGGFGLATRAAMSVARFAKGRMGQAEKMTSGKGKATETPASGSTPSGSAPTATNPSLLSRFRADESGAGKSPFSLGGKSYKANSRARTNPGEPISYETASFRGYPELRDYGQVGKTNSAPMQQVVNDAASGRPMRLLRDETNLRSPYDQYRVVCETSNQVFGVLKEYCYGIWRDTGGYNELAANQYLRSLNLEGSNFLEVLGAGKYATEYGGFERLAVIYNYTTATSLNVLCKEGRLPAYELGKSTGGINNIQGPVIQLEYAERFADHFATSVDSAIINVGYFGCDLTKYNIPIALWHYLRKVEAVLIEQQGRLNLGKTNFENIRYDGSLTHTEVASVLRSLNLEGMPAGIVFDKHEMISNIRLQAPSKAVADQNIADFLRGYNEACTAPIHPFIDTFAELDVKMRTIHREIRRGNVGDVIDDMAYEVYEAIREHILLSPI